VSLVVQYTGLVKNLITLGGKGHLNPIFLAAIAALYVAMSVGLSVGPNEFQEVL
jgi:hypothetical protein